MADNFAFAWLALALYNISVMKAERLSERVRATTRRLEEIAVRVVIGSLIESEEDRRKRDRELAPWRQETVRRLMSVNAPLEEIEDRLGE